MPRLQTRSPGSSLTGALAAPSLLLPFWEENQAGSLTRESILTLAARQTHRVLRCSKLEARRMLYTGLQGSPFPYRAAGLWEGAGVWSPLPR